MNFRGVPLNRPTVRIHSFHYLLLLPMRFLYSTFIAMVLASGTVRAASPATRFELRDGDRVVFLGDTLVEREQYYGWAEVMLTSRFPARNVAFRNLGWSADTPAGTSRIGRSLLMAGQEPPGEGWRVLQQQITEANPTVIFISYGMAASLEADLGLKAFIADYTRLLDSVAKLAPAARVMLLGPSRHEALGAPYPDPAAHNGALKRVDTAVRVVATKYGLPYFSVFDTLDTPMEAAKADGPRLTDNGIHLNSHGYRALAEKLEDFLLGPELPASSWRTSAATEALRQAILRKNAYFFKRSRPTNVAYLYGFRKREQGQNASEVPGFDRFIATEEQNIAKLRRLSGAGGAEAHVPAQKVQISVPSLPHPNFIVDDNLEVTLWAEDPMIKKPIQINFDPQGRLWVVTSEIYPQIAPGQAATDKIIILEDTTGKGRADRATVFADNLSIPTGMVPGNGGVYVGQNTDLLFLHDSDADGRADQRRIVLSGFGTEDTHHNVHTLRWGPDGALYFSQSIYTRTHIETPYEIVRHAAGGTFRFDPRVDQLGLLFRGMANPWGLQFDEFGRSFLSDGAGNKGIYWGMQGAAYLHAQPPARRLMESISPGTYPKFISLEIIRSAHFPDEWQGDQITADFRAGRIVRFKVSPQGSGFVTREMPDVVRTTDISFRPVDVRLGPDGALYVADWSNPIIQHGEVDFRDPRRDKLHGRIWRITAKKRPLVARQDFTRVDNTALLDALLSPNANDRQQATRVLVERGADRVKADVGNWTARHPEARARFHAWVIYDALKLSAPELLKGLIASSEPEIRAAIATAFPPGEAIDPLARLVADPSPQVRLAAVRALGRFGTTRAAELALGVLEQPMDPFLEYALALTMNELGGPWLSAVRSGEWSFRGRENQLTFGLNAIDPSLVSGVLGELLAAHPLPRDGSGPWFGLIAAAGGPAQQQFLLDQVFAGTLDETAVPGALASVADAARLRGVKLNGDLTRLSALLTARSPEVRLAAVNLVGILKSRDFVPQLLGIVTRPAVPPTERGAAFAALRDIGDAGVSRELQRLARAPHDHEIRREAVVAFAGIDLGAALPDVFAVLAATTTEEEAATLWRAILSLSGAGDFLANEIPKAKLPQMVARAGLRPAREAPQNEALVRALLAASGLALSNVQLSAEEIQQLAHQATQAGNAIRGERIYRRPELACVACHAIGGAGGTIGPDLTSIGASAPADYLVESVLYPNAKIKEGYHAVSITTTEKKELSGMVVRESPTELVLRDGANQDASVAVQSIAKRTSIGSMMPAGLVDGLVPEERLDLFKFLSQLGRPGGFDAGKSGVARLWNLYVATSANQQLGVDRVIHGDTTLRDWISIFALVNGSLDADLLRSHFVSVPWRRGLFVATRFSSAQGAPAAFKLSGAAKAAWLNGAPIEMSGSLSFSLRPGVNTLVFELEENQLPSELKLTSDDVTFINN